MRIISDALKDKINSQNQTLFDKSDPKMQVSIARAKNTVVDSTYWTVETIREIPGLGDISVAPRRFKAVGRPNRIYEIHVINGIVKTSIREYPDKLKDGFIDQFSLGAGSSVAVAFNGHWQRYRNLYRLITEEKPYISWVASDGKLWVQKWDDVSSRLQLSSGVSKVRMIRAWKNTVINYLDQGLVVAYIKTDGKVYYRNFCIQEDYAEAWEYEKELTDFTGTAINVNLFITNDYRMGFIIEDSLGKIHWLVTPRNWGGMASPAENIAIGITNLSFKVTPIKYYDAFDNERIRTSIADVFVNLAEPIYPVPLSAENPSKSVIQLLLKFSHVIDYDLTAVKSAFAIKDSANTVFQIVTTQAGVNASELIFNMENFAGAQGKMRIIYDRTVIELDSLNQGSRFPIESFSFEFTPDLTPPEGHTKENIIAGIAELAFTVLKVDYINSCELENVNVSISDVSIVVTKVGENPL